MVIHLFYPFANQCSNLYVFINGPCKAIIPLALKLKDVVMLILGPTIIVILPRKIDTLILFLFFKKGFDCYSFIICSDFNFLLMVSFEVCFFFSIDFFTFFLITRE